jgi:hypothetical protein
MLNVCFAGHVLPAVLNVSLANRPTFQWRSEELGLDMTFRVEIRDGSIRIDCNLNKYEDAYLVPLFMRAQDIATASVDLAAFATGSGLSVVLEEFSDPTGAVTPLAAQQPSLAALVYAVKPGTSEFDKVLQFVLAEPQLYLAMRDLSSAIAAPHRAVLHCARAMRTVGRLFGLSWAPSQRAWLTFRDNLQISQAFMQAFLQRKERDGPPISEANATEVIQRAWMVMNRVFEYLKRGRQPLPLSEFPLLV